MRTLVAALLIALAPAPGQVEDPVDDLRRAFKPARDAEAAQARRAAALEAAAGIDSPAAADALLEAYLQLEQELEKPERRHREQIEQGSRNKHEEKRLDLDPLRDLQEIVLTHMRGLEAPASLEPLVEQALLARRMPLSLRLELAGRAGEVSAQALPHLDKALKKSSKPEALLTALVAMRGMGPASAPAGGKGIAALRHSDAAVREAAADALAQMALPGSIVPLIDRLEHERGRARLHVTSALQVITRQNIAGMSRAWREWLEKEGGPFVDGAVELGGGEPLAPGGSDASRYFDIPLDGESILFLIDRSNSMHETMNMDAESGETRIERAKTELIRALGALRPGQRFNVLTFAGSLKRFAPEMVLAEPKVVAKAQEWVREAALELGTRLYDALELGFATAGRGMEDSYYDSSADTFFVLTDGKPIVSGKSDKTQRILAAVARWNLLDRVTIHVIGLGDSVPKTFLRKLASHNGGRFVHEQSVKEVQGEDTSHTPQR